jgi:hypothetical protein
MGHIDTYSIPSAGSSKRGFYKYGWIWSDIVYERPAWLSPPSNTKYSYCRTLRLLSLIFAWRIKSWMNTCPPPVPLDYISVLLFVSPYFVYIWRWPGHPSSHPKTPIFYPGLHVSSLHTNSHFEQFTQIPSAQPCYPCLPSPLRVFDYPSILTSPHEFCAV